jgi:hypothetical protein
MSPRGLTTHKHLLDSLEKRGEGRDHVDCVRAISEVLGYDIPEERKASFQCFGEFVVTPLFHNLPHWAGNLTARRNKWYFGCSVGIQSHVRGALAAAHYHADRLGTIQEEVNGIIDHFAAGDMGCIGYTWVLDIEYHAFILAIRRGLDYLACALACFFKQQSDSFRRFPSSIARPKLYPEVAAALIEAHARHVAHLQFVLDEGPKSVRNRIAHWEFVSAGSVNLREDGIFLVGGPENINWPPGSKILTLDSALSGRLDAFHACVDDMIHTFIRAIQAAS